jgi:hypothetical protein
MLAPATRRLAVITAALLLAYLASQVTIGMILHPVGTDLAFRFQLATDKTVALEVLHLWGEAGRAQFAKHFRLDFIHPLLYAALLYSALKLFCSVWLSNGALRWVYALPWIAGACDELENLCELRILAQLDAVAPGVVVASGSFASVKWTLAGICVVLCLAGVVRSVAHGLPQPRSSP